MAMNMLYDTEGNPRFTKSYLIPVGDLSLEARVVMRQDSDNILIQNALRLRVRDDPKDLIVRDILPNADLGLAASDDWLVPVAGVVGAESVYFSVALPNTVVHAYYGISVETVPFTFSRIRLAQSATATNVKGVFQLEQLFSRLEPVGYFSQPVIFPNQQVIRVLLMARIASLLNTQRVTLLGRAAEPIGDTISSPGL